MYMVSPTRGDRRRTARSSGSSVSERTRRAGRARAAADRSRSPGSEFVIPCDMVLVAIGQKQDNSFLGELLPNRDRRGVPFLDQNLRTELPNVWALGRLRGQPDQLHLLDRRGQARRRLDRPASCAAPSRGSRRWRSPASRPSSSATPNPLMAEGIAEWSLTAMSRRLVWGDDYAGVGRQVMPSLPVRGSRHRHARHDARGRSRLHQADRASRRPSAACNASSTSSSTATAASSATAASMPARTSASR